MRVYRQPAEPGQVMLKLMFNMGRGRVRIDARLGSGLPWGSGGPQRGAMVELSSQLRSAARAAAVRPGFSAFVVATLALGIGVNGAVFSLVDALLLRPPRVAANERLVHVYSSVPGGVLSHEPTAFPDYESLRDGVRSFDALAAYAWYPLALERGDGSELLMAEAVTGNYFAALGVVPALGRALGEHDDRPGAAASVAVLSDDAWRRHFGGAKDVLGRELRLNGQRFTIVGVAPRGFRSMVAGLAPDLWLPLRAAVALPAGITINFGLRTPGLDRIADRGQRWVWVTGRLRPGATLEGARTEIAALASRLGHEFPETNAQRALTAVPAADVRLLPGVDRAVWTGSLLVTGVFGAGLLLAGTNLAGLFLARVLGRRREIATRLALGAGRGQLVRQLFLEGLLLAACGACLGLLLTAAANAWFQRIASPQAAAVSWPLALALAPAIDLRVLGFTIATALVSALVFALLPALEATRLDLAGILRELGAGRSTARSGGLQDTLVAAQVALSLVLLAGAAVAFERLLQYTRTDPGFRAERAAAVTLSPDLVGYGVDEAEQFYARLRDRVSEIPGVRATAFASHLPLSFAANWTDLGLEPGGGKRARRRPLVDTASVGAGYFETLGIPLIAGRGFDDRDGPSGRRVVVVNETLAHLLWPGSTAVGRHAWLRDTPVEVIGVAHDGKYRSLWESPRPFVYTCLAQDRRVTRTLVVRTAGDPRRMLPAIGAALRALDPRVPTSRPRLLSEAAADALFLPRAAAFVLGFFGALSLALASLGIAGVMACLSQARGHEIGVRAALGASRRTILIWLLRRGLGPVMLGLLVGSTLAAAGAWGLSRFVIGLETTPSRALLAAASLLAAAALAAAALPAWRASGLAPAAALRRE